MIAPTKKSSSSLSFIVMGGSKYDVQNRVLSVCPYTGIRAIAVTPLAPPEWKLGWVCIGSDTVFQALFAHLSNMLYVRPVVYVCDPDFRLFFDFRTAVDYDTDRVVRVSGYLAT